MRPRDFCYWLQGYCELSQAATFSTKQLNLIEAHLKMVAVSDEALAKSEASRFCIWLQDFLAWRSETEPMPRDRAVKVKRRLSRVFVHEIDPSFPADQQEILSDIHSEVVDVDLGRSIFGENWEPGMKC